MSDLALQWIGHYGVFAVFGLLTVGIFGLPVPDETLLTFAGVLVAQGRVRFIPIWVAAALGSMVGITLSYALGRTVGLAFVTTYGRRLRITPAELDSVGRWFAKGGKWTLTFGFFVPGVRHLTAIVAGSSRLAFPAFARYAYAGACFWTVSFVTVGWYVGDRWNIVLRQLHHHLMIALVGLVAVAVAYALIRRRAGL